MADKQSLLRFHVYDDEGELFRKFYSKQDAEGFLQEGWKLVVIPKQKKAVQSFDDLGEPPF